MTDTFDRDQNEAAASGQSAQQEPATQSAQQQDAQQPLQDGEPIAQQPLQEAEPAAQQPSQEGEPTDQQPPQEGESAQQQPQASGEKEPIVITAVQFPKIDPQDLPDAQHGASDNPNAIEDIPMEEEELPMLEDDQPIDKGKLYNFVAKMDDVQFRRAQIIFGALLGALASICLMIPIPGESSGNSMWNFVIALIIAIWIPRIVERKIEQRIPIAQRWMLIVFVIGMAVSIGFNVLNSDQMQQATQLASPSPSAAAPAATPAP